MAHLSSSGLLALIFSGSGEVAWRIWPENHAAYQKHHGVYVGDVGNFIVTCHDCDAVLWKVQSNEARPSGRIVGHTAEILKVHLWLSLPQETKLDLRAMQPW